MNKVCYTAIISPYEELKEPKVIPAGWDFICFTDQPLTSNVWKIVQVEQLPEGAQRSARQIKILPHKFVPEYEFSLWLDAAFQINVDLNSLWSKWFKPPFSCPNHPIRNCVYREIASCIANKRGDEEQLRNQLAEYKKKSVPEFNGVITSGVLLRQNTLGVQRMCDEWWEEVSKYSVRDQVAFCSISRGWKFHNFTWDYSQAKDLKYYKHFHKRH